MAEVPFKLSTSSRRFWLVDHVTDKLANQVKRRTLRPRGIGCQLAVAQSAVGALRSHRRFNSCSGGEHLSAELTGFDISNDNSFGFSSSHYVLK